MVARVAVIADGGGLLVLYSASGQRIDTVIAQAIRFGVAIVVMVVIAQLSPSTFLRWAPFAYGLGLAMLLAVEIAGDVGMGQSGGLKYRALFDFNHLR